jgi:hypothetical protein
MLVAMEFLSQNQNIGGSKIALHIDPGTDDGPN